MYQFLVDNSIYVVLGIVLIIWAGISIFLWMLDKKVTNLEKIVFGNKGDVNNEN